MSVFSAPIPLSKREFTELRLQILCNTHSLFECSLFLQPYQLVVAISESEALGVCNIPSHTLCSKLISVSAFLSVFCAQKTICVLSVIWNSLWPGPFNDGISMSAALEGCSPFVGDSRHFMGIFTLLSRHTYHSKKLAVPAEPWSIFCTKAPENISTQDQYSLTLTHAYCL